LGKDVTLDINGFTLKYADGNYQHISHSCFEENDKGWKLSKAPGANVVSTADVHVLSPKKIMSLKKGDEIILPMSGCLFQTAPILPCAMKIRLYVDYELAKGAGSISIKNGIIESAAGGILSGGEARNIRAFYGSRKSIRLLK